MATMTAEDAKRIVSNTPPNKAFWVNNGPVIRSLAELSAAAKKLAPAQFMHHANKDKNDFAKWVEEVVRDPVLAKSVKLAKTKDELATAVASRIKQLQKLAK